MNKLKLCKYKFTLRFAEEAALPPFIGNTLRGALGQALCDDFPQAYASVFKTESAVSAPNPFVLSAPYPGKGVYCAGETLNFSVTLFGTACGYENDILSAVRLMCRGKLASAELIASKQVYSREWSDVGTESIPYTDTLTVNFITPTEILSKHEAVTELSFAGFIDSLFGRIGGIIDSYTDREFVVPYVLVANKPYIKTDGKFSPVRFQTNGQPINGFIGTVRFFGDVTRYLPYIDLGSQIHIGKKTTRGCGQYSYEI